MNKTRYCPGVGSVNGYIFAAGGGSQSNPEDVESMERFDPVTELWTEVTPMKVQRQFMTLGVLNGNLYVAGDHGAVERYNPSTHQWNFVSSRNTFTTSVAMA